jgi:hypothetical protein
VPVPSAAADREGIASSRYPTIKLEVRFLDIKYLFEDQLVGLPLTRGIKEPVPMHIGRI